MGAKQRRQRWLIFLLVLVPHLALVVLAMRTAGTSNLSSEESQPLVLLLLPQVPREQSAAAGRPAVQSRATPRGRETSPPGVEPQPTEPPPETPAPIDWSEEARLAVQNALAAADRQAKFRNLASLSPAQLDRIQKNRRVSTPPGIDWHHGRFEFDKKSGVPMFWINENCVIAAPLMLMVFCKVGHVQANGGLFNHRRDAH